MAISGIFSVDLSPVYVELGNTLGAYVVEPGEDPMIVLNSSLKDKDNLIANLVYNALVRFHNSLLDVYRLFPIIQYFEDLPEARHEAQIVMIRKYHRVQRCNTCGGRVDGHYERTRIIGS